MAKDYSPTNTPELEPGVKKVMEARSKKIVERASAALSRSTGAQGLVKTLHSAYDGDLDAGLALKKMALGESNSSTDFPMLFGQVTQIGMQGQYARLPQQWPAFSMRQTVGDFRRQRSMSFNMTTDQYPVQNGGAPRHPAALPRIPELTEYPTFSLEEQGQDWALAKYGGRFPFSFELFINDELNIIQQLPAEMAAQARDTEDILTTGVLADATGPNPNFFRSDWDFGPQAPAGNFMEGNPPLTIDTLQQAMFEITRRQLNGRTITVPRFTLIVPPALALTAREILRASSYRRVRVDQVTGDELQFNIPDPLADLPPITLLVSEWLPLIDQSENAATTWYLVPTGGTTGTRPVIVTGFLRGREAPELRINGDTGRSVGGGDISPFEGSFSHDDVQYRVRHILGAAGLDPTPVLASRGNSEDEHTAP